MRKSLTATLIVLAAVGAGIVPAAASSAATPTRRVVWGVTGFSVTHPSTVVWPRKTFSTKPAADAYLSQVRTLESQVCKLAPVSCATFAESLVSVG